VFVDHLEFSFCFIFCETMVSDLVVLKTTKSHFQCFQSFSWRHVFYSNDIFPFYFFHPLSNLSLSLSLCCFSHASVTPSLFTTKKKKSTFSFTLFVINPIDSLSPPHTCTFYIHSSLVTLFYYSHCVKFSPHEHITSVLLFWDLDKGCEV